MTLADPGSATDVTRDASSDASVGGPTPSTGVDAGRELGVAPERAPEPPPAALLAFGEQLGLARTYADLLATIGVERGLIGPHEGARIWDRHLLNGALLVQLVPLSVHVADIGSGAGLPGIPLALARPDLRLTLIESKARRVTFLREVCATLRIDARVAVLHGRVEELPGVYDVVTARAVAPLRQLATWAAKACRRGGTLCAMRGDDAEIELDAARPGLPRQGWSDAGVRLLSADGVTPTRVVVATRR